LLFCSVGCWGVVVHSHGVVGVDVVLGSVRVNDVDDGGVGVVVGGYGVDIRVVADVCGGCCGVVGVVGIAVGVCGDVVVKCVCWCCCCWC